MNLKSKYMGMEIATPIVAAASPLTGNLRTLQRLERAGAGAVVLPSLFEEQIEHEEVEIQRLLDYGAENSPEVTGYFPELQEYRTGPVSYLKLIEEAKEKLSIPVIASLNGSSTGGWIEYAKLMQQAGADAIELNIYFVATDPEVSGSDVERRYVDLVLAICKEVNIPVAVKVGPFFSSMANMAVRLESAGAAGLVLFNRFLQPDIGLEDLEVVPTVQLSREEELRLPLRWIAILREHIKGSLAATSGVHSAEDVTKLVLAGADGVQIASSVLRRGPEFLTELRDGLTRWMEENEYESVEQMKGSMSQANIPDPEAFERANYMEALRSYTADLP
jgi:dihydroorotate dehydrogenase (fumarate)